MKKTREGRNLSVDDGENAAIWSKEEKKVIPSCGDSCINGAKNEIGKVRIER
jgi:hypothetical protein